MMVDDDGGDDGSLLLTVQKTLINHGDAHGADMQL